MKRFFVFLCTALSLGAAETVKVSVILPLSGDSAFLGTQMREGILMRAEEQKAKADARFTYDWSFEDDTNKPATAVLAYRKAVGLEKREVVIAPCASDTLAPFAARDKKLFWGMSWDERAAADRLAFIHCTPVQPQAQLLLETLKGLGVTRVGLVSVTQQGAMRMERELKEIAPQMGMTLDVVRTNPDELDMRSVVLKLKQGHPQAYVSIVIMPAFEILAKAVRQIDPDAIFTAIEGFSYLSDLKPYNGSFYVAGNEATTDFAARFEAARGKPAIAFAANAYDIADLTINAYETLGKRLGRKPTTTEVATELYGLKDYSGAIGTLTMGASRIVKSPAVLKCIADGKAQLITLEELKAQLKR
jgi:ABC-type branched-subunit amino acid transport system substrate-binding protein